MARDLRFYTDKRRHESEGRHFDSTKFSFELGGTTRQRFAISGQVSIGVVEHAMFWDLPRLGTTDVVCNRSLAKLRGGDGRRMP